MMNCKDTTFTKTTCDEQKVNTTSHAFKMPACKLCYATCGSCNYYEKYGVDKAWCNYHHRDTSSSNPACSYYE